MTISSSLGGVGLLGQFINPGSGGIVTPPPFDQTNVGAWYNFRDASKVLTDTNMGYTTAGEVKDQTGNGHDLIQGIKEFQPTWTSAGAYFDTNKFLQSYQNIGLLAGITQYTMAVVISLDGSVTVPAVQRDVIYISKAATPSTARADLHITQANSPAGRRARHNQSVSDGTTFVGATSAVSVPNSTPFNLIMDVDLTTNLRTFYVNGVVDANISAAASAPGVMAAGEPLAFNFGNGASQATPMVGTARIAVIINGTQTLAQRMSLQSYLTAQTA